ncbi:hypothetical protein HED60_01415 [Planctomycetales bacterium ZRK34]|nr:hypothetical protein HED60_01415 [Planctomycetales bacterium ZRK34]
MDNATRNRLRELLFYVVPDPDEVISDDVLEQSESVGWHEAEQMKTEFRSLVESLDEHPDVRDIVLASLNDMDASSNESHGNDTEWMNVRDVMGRRIRRALAPLVDV